MQTPRDKLVNKLLIKTREIISHELYPIGLDQVDLILKEDNELDEFDKERYRHMRWIIDIVIPYVYQIGKVDGADNLRMALKNLLDIDSNIEHYESIK